MQIFQRQEEVKSGHDSQDKFAAGTNFETVPYSSYNSLYSSIQHDFRGEDTTFNDVRTAQISRQQGTFF